MIVQTAAAGVPNLVITQIDHALMSGQFARAFGNSRFADLEPEAPVLFVAEHHDEGWRAIDERVEQDPETGLPYHLTRTPLPYLLETSAASPEFNGYYHPYSGILSSMHTCGLFNGRYGLSDKVFIDMVPEMQRGDVAMLLVDELARQESLKAQLDGSPLQLACEEQVLFHNYKLLQFFDTLALYFHLTQESARAFSSFLHVPQEVAEDAQVQIARREAGVYALSPYPFREPEMAFSYRARPMSPQPVGSDLAALFAAIEPVTERVVLVNGSL